MRRFFIFLILILCATPSHAIDIKAKRISVDDAGGHFVADNVEKVLQEIGASSMTDTNASTICDGDNVLQGDGDCVPLSSGSGDMEKSVYDTDDDGSVDSAGSVPWAGISNIPVDIADGDDDTTCDGLSCNVSNTGTLDGYEATDLLDNTDDQTCAEVLGCVEGAYSSLSDLQAAVSNDFHNLGGTDDDAPDDDSEVPDAITINNGVLYAPNESGNVGIMTINPQRELSVVGKIGVGKSPDAITVSAPLAVSVSSSGTIAEFGYQLDSSDDRKLQIGYDGGNDYVNIRAKNSDLKIGVDANTSIIHIEEDTGDVSFFPESGSGETPTLQISGYKASDQSRTATIGMSSDIDDALFFDGVSNFLFDGDLMTSSLGAYHASPGLSIAYNSMPFLKFGNDEDVAYDGSQLGFWWDDCDTGDCEIQFRTENGTYLPFHGGMLKTTYLYVGTNVYTDGQVLRVGDNASATGGRAFTISHDSTGVVMLAESANASGILMDFNSTYIPGGDAAYRFKDVAGQSYTMGYDYSLNSFVISRGYNYPSSLSNLNKSFVIDSDGRVGMVNAYDPKAPFEVKVGAGSQAVINRLAEINPMSEVANGRSSAVSGGTLYRGGPTYRTYGSSWNANTEGQYIKIDLGQTIPILACSFGTSWRADGRFVPQGYTIDYSTDDLNWTEWTAVTGNTDIEVYHEITPTNMRYIRITVDDFQDGQANTNMAFFQAWTRNYGAGSGVNQLTTPYNTDDLKMSLTGDFYPADDDTSDLGTATNQWKDGYFNGTIYTDGLSVVDTTNLGDGGTTNYASFSSSGDLTMAGAADYLVGLNRYAFKYSVDEDAGLKFSSTNFGQFEFRDVGGAVAFSVEANGSGNAYVKGGLEVDGDIQADGGITLANNEAITRGTSVRRLDVAYNDSSPTIALTVADGYIITDVYAKVTTTWDGTGTIKVGDGDNDDGYLNLTNSDLSSTGWKGLGMMDYDRGVYLTETFDVFGYAKRYAYSGADTIDIIITTGTSTQGNLELYIVYQKLK